jgi:hypothetical protein
MRNAPSVVFPVGRCAFQGWLLVALAGLSGLSGLLFLVVSDVRILGGWGRLDCALGVVVWLAWTTWAALSWLRSPEGTLHWVSGCSEEGHPGGNWSWTDRTGAEPVILTGMERLIDLQSRVLLHFSGPKIGAQWVWAERASSPSSWNDLRRALLASRA